MNDKAGHEVAYELRCAIVTCRIIFDCIYFKIEQKIEVVRVTAQTLMKRVIKRAGCEDFHGLCCRHETVVLPKRARLGSVVEYTHHGCYMTLPAEAQLATSGWKTGGSIRSLITKGAALMATAYAASVSSSGTIGVDTTTSIKPTSVITPDMEMRLFNGVTVYGHIGMNQPLSDLVTEYQDVFIDQGTTVDIPEEE